VMVVMVVVMILLTTKSSRALILMANPPSYPNVFQPFAHKMSIFHVHRFPEEIITNVWVWVWVYHSIIAYLHHECYCIFLSKSMNGYFMCRICSVIVMLSCIIILET
jgi:hypothetical protein